MTFYRNVVCGYLSLEDNFRSWYYIL